MRNLTTSILVQNPHLPETGLHQSMLNNIRLLEPDEIFNATGLKTTDTTTDGRDVEDGIRTFFIADAIRQILPEAIRRIFSTGPTQSSQDSSSPTFPQFPHLDALTPLKTKITQIDAVYQNEGTIAGTYGVHDEIWTSKLGFSQEDAGEKALPDTPEALDQDDHDHDHGKSDFEERLWLVYGDQLTTHHIRSVKKEQRYASRHYDRRD